MFFLFRILVTRPRTESARFFPAPSSTLSLSVSLCLSSPSFDFPHSLSRACLTPKTRARKGTKEKERLERWRSYLKYKHRRFKKERKRDRLRNARKRCRIQFVTVFLVSLFTPNQPTNCLSFVSFSFVIPCQSRKQNFDLGSLEERWTRAIDSIGC